MCERTEDTEILDMEDAGLIGDISSLRPGRDEDDDIIVEFFGSDEMEELECKRDAEGGLGASFFFFLIGGCGAEGFCSSKSFGGPNPFLSFALAPVFFTLPDLGAGTGGSMVKSLITLVSTE